MKEIDYFRFDRSCTIFCREKEEKVKAYLTLRAKNMQLEETGKGKTWSQLALRHGSTVLTINRSVFVGPGFAGPGRQFNKTVVGAGNFFKDAPIKDKDVRQGILDHIYGTAVILGCSADPAFSPELGHYKLLFGIAKITSGLIFDGQGMLDAHGELVLDKFGQSGLQVFSEKELG
jgi:hypothetical protein